MKTYKASKGAQFTDEDAQTYGKCVEEIAEKKGKVTPSDIVTEGKNPKSPLFNYFDWDDKNAAEKYRIIQARHLINHLTVVVTINGGELREHKAFFNVNETPFDKIKNKVYVTMIRALSEPELRKQVLARAIREVEYWQSKYNEYSEFSEIFDAISKTKKEVGDS